MTGHKHCCANCHFFQDSGLSGQGWCTHPKRQVSQNLKIVVRKQELACRNGWGDDLWTDPAIAAERVADDRLVASSTPVPQASVPVEPEDRLIARDRTPNTAAQIDQDDRTEVMRRGSREAILRARERHLERQGAPVSPAAAPDDSGSPADERPATEAKPLPQRSIIPAVPRAEGVTNRNNQDDRIWDDIPAITGDVELPLLRGAFRLPGQPENREATTPASAGEPSRYDLALQKAQAYRVAQAKDVSDDVVTSTVSVREPRIQPRTPANEPDIIDEIVRYEPQRGTEPDRARIDDDVLETDDAYLDEDYELDRTFRAEAPSRQSGHRWWKSFGRSRVFGTDGREDRVVSAPVEEIVEPAPMDDDVVVRPAPSVVVSEPRPGLQITWDNRALAPQAQHMEPALEFASLDYLDDHGPAEFEPRGFMTDDRAPMSRFGSGSPRDAGPTRAPDRRGDRIPGTDRNLHRWTYHERPEGESGTARETAPVAAAAFDPEPDPAPIDHRPQTATFDVDAGPAPDFDIRRVIARNVEPLLDMTVEIAPDIPRECGTCRHFRASGNGERGWCTNTWAFPHRPLVNADAVHCSSSIGCWWLPTDEDWDPEEYFDWLDQATPRTDRLVAALYGEEETRQYGN